MNLSYDEPLVGSLALMLSGVALAIAVGPWQQPYQLRSVCAVQRRFGKPAARGLWVLVAAASLVSGLAILSGIRPAFAVPAGDLRTAVEQELR